MCPSCGRALDYSNHVLGTLLSQDVAGAVVEILFACRGCLSILRDVRRHSPFGSSVTNDGDVTCVHPGARVHREIERLRDAPPGDVMRVFTEIAADPQRRDLLRVPEVFGTVRALYRGSVTLLDDAVCGWRRSDGDSIPWPPLIRWSRFGREMARVGRLFPNPFSEADRSRGVLRHEAGDDTFLLLPAGCRLALHQAAKNILLAVGPDDTPMAVAPDLAIPAFD